MYVQNNEITDVFPSKGHSAACVPQVHDIKLRKYRNQLIDYAIEDPTRTIDDSYRMVLNLIKEEDPNYAAFFPPKEKLSSLYNAKIRRLNPPIPEDLANLEIPFPFNTYNGQPFILHNESFAVGERQETLLLFGTVEFLQLLVTTVDRQQCPWVVHSKWSLNHSTNYSPFILFG